MTRQIIGLILILALAFLIIPATANNLTVSNAQVNTIGDTATVTLILDAAPNGLAGYNLSVSLSDPGVAEITSVTYPAWSTYNDNSSLPADSAWIKAYDGGSGQYGNVAPGASNILLATLTIRGDAGGVVTVNVVPIQIDEDGPGLISPTVVAGTFTVNVPVSPPEAAFTANPVSGTMPLSVQFTDQSTGAGLTYAWDFENDGHIDSTDRNPLHTYALNGTYPVSLTVTSTNGVDTELKSGYIIVNVVPPGANFARTPQQGPAPLEVHFSYTHGGGVPDSWAWDFTNDGTIESTLEDPVFVYDTPGTYTVNLTTTNSGGSNSDQKTVTVEAAVSTPPVAAFTANATSGNAPLSVKFTDASIGTGITSWAWDFTNDGTVDSNDQSPLHSYTSPGTYSVNLTVTNASGSDNEIKTGYITVASPDDFINPGFETGNLNGWTAGSSTSITTTKHSGTYAANFGQLGDNETNFVQQDVNLTGMESILFWSYGEGTNGKCYVYIDDVLVRSPNVGPSTWTRITIPVSYTGIHTVTVRWPRGYGMDVDDFSMRAIGVNTAPVANSQSVSTNYNGAKIITLSGTDANGDPLTYAVVGSPSHGSLTGTAPLLTYSPAAGYVGTDSFTFTANDGTVDSAPATVDITVTESAVTPVTAFSAIPTSGEAPLPVQFTDSSSNTPDSWRWNFGDSPGSIYVADNGGYSLQEIYPNGSTRSVGAGQISSPFGVAVDAQGNVYEADYDFTFGAMKIYPNGTAVKLGSGISCSSSGIAVDGQGNVFVAAYGNSVVYKVYPDGTTVTWGSGYGQPYGVEVDAQGNVYVADGASVWKIYPNGTTMSLGSFSGPWDVSVDHNGNVYVACFDGAQVQKISPDGSSTAVGSGFTNPSSVAVDDFSGNVYVADGGSNTLFVIYPDGTTVPLKTGFTFLSGVAVKPADSGQHNPTHTYSTPGTYNVSLIASNSGGSNLLTQTGYITVSEQNTQRVYLVPQSNVVATGNSQVYFVFVTSLPDGLAGSNITYTLDNPAVGTITGFTVPPWATAFNRSSGIPADELWVEGVDINQVNPGATGVSLGTITVRADSPGTTAIRLTVNEMDSDNHGSAITPALTNGEMTVYAPVAADFTADNLTGYAPLHVKFTDASTGSPGPLSWAWDFNNDGVVDSTLRNPEHDFTAAGKYTVNLTVTGTYNSDTETKVQYIWAKYNVAVFPGYTNYPTDPDFDGVYEDVNGNGRYDFDDVVAYYQNMAWIRSNASVGIVPYDLNGNGRIDFDDVVVLYLEVLRN